MSLKDNYGSTSFRVEEYKRPKFDVNFKPVEGVFKLNEEVTVVGTAQAFAGNFVDGAEVKYRVTRTVRFPFWCLYYYGYMPSSPQIQVADGTVTTDEKGDFKVVFKAKFNELIAICNIIKKIKDKKIDIDALKFRQNQIINLSMMKNTFRMICKLYDK